MSTAGHEHQRQPAAAIVEGEEQIKQQAADVG